MSTQHGKAVIVHKSKIRRALVRIRQTDKPREIKKAVERFIGAIDADGTDEALTEAHVNLERKASGAPFPALASIDDIASGFGLEPART